MNSVWFLGDIHGATGILAQALLATDGPLIQVGDFGFAPETLEWIADRSFDRPVYLMDGNHEHHDLLPSLDPGLHRLAPNCWYVGRGTVAEIAGLRIGFMGGGCSIDKHLRQKRGWHWSELEIVTDEQVDALIAEVRRTGQIDLLVTHQPPESLIQAHFDPMDKVRLFGVPPDWVGAGSSLRLDRLWDALDRPPLISGHMHRRIFGDGYRMLDVNELFSIPARSRGQSC